MLSLEFLRTNARLLTFGVTMAFFSSFGQTFFISLFGSEIRDAFDLGHGEFGSLYAGATLSSAATIMLVGWLIDRHSLKLFSCVTVVGLAIACMAMAHLSGIVALALTLFGLRLFGQGLISHASLVTMGRYFSRQRGRAIAVASFGYSIGEVLLPPLVVLALGFVAWQTIWQSAALFLIAVAVPTIIWILRSIPVSPEALSEHSSEVEQVDWTVRQTLADPGLYLRLPVTLATSALGTGLVFHQVYIAETKGWSLALIAGSFSLYAVTAIIATIAAGVMVDKVSATRVMPYYLLPLAVTCILVATLEANWGAPVYYGVMGISSGIHFGVTGAVWAELYGVRHLGAIRSVMQAAMVFSSGIMPAIMGILFDWGISVAAIGWGAAVYCLFSSGLAGLASKPDRHNPHGQPKKTPAG